jgi:hypothetical protein
MIRRTRQEIFLSRAGTCAGGSPGLALSGEYVEHRLALERRDDSRDLACFAFRTSHGFHLTVITLADVAAAYPQAIPDIRFGSKPLPELRGAARRRDFAAVHLPVIVSFRL